MRSKWMEHSIVLSTGKARLELYALLKGWGAMWKAQGADISRISIGKSGVKDGQ